MVRTRGEKAASGVRFVRRRSDAARAVGLHQRAAVWLLVVRHAHHEHIYFDPEQRTRKRERGSPLSGAGFRADAPDAFLAVIEGLSDGGVRLMAPGRAHAFVLVI